MPAADVRLLSQVPDSESHAYKDAVEEMESLITYLGRWRLMTAVVQIFLLCFDEDFPSRCSNVLSLPQKLLLIAPEIPNYL